MTVVWQILIELFLHFKKEYQVNSRNKPIYTGFHMQLRSWEITLQPELCPA